jgi:hypothetical protein
MRAAYLSVFCTNGYSYVLSKGAAQVRRILDEHDSALERTVMEAFPHTELTSDALVIPAALGGLGDFFIVMLRLKSKRTRYVAVLLPGVDGCDWNTLMKVNVGHNSRLRVETTPENWTSRLVVDFSDDPVTNMRNSEVFKP